jgi:hypothetical protein
MERRGERELLRDPAATSVTAMERKLHEDAHDGLDHALMRTQCPWCRRRRQIAAGQEAGDKGYSIACIEGLVGGKACESGPDTPAAPQVLGTVAECLQMYEGILDHTGERGRW